MNPSHCVLEPKRKSEVKKAGVAAALTLSTLLVLVTNSGTAQTASPAIVATQGITFSGLTGPNLSPFTSYQDGDFVVNPTSGDWLESTAYGNPYPSILDGPLNSPGPGVIAITDGAGNFTLSGLDFSSNNGKSLYDIQGYLNGALAYDESGEFQGTFGPFSFSTLLTANPSVALDGLLISIIPETGTTSVNLDNIQVSTVPMVVMPEPGGYPLFAFGLGLAGLVRLRSKTTK
jgi:hypothetical protein